MLTNWGPALARSLKDTMGLDGPADLAVWLQAATRAGAAQQVQAFARLREWLDVVDAQVRERDHELARARAGAADSDRLRLAMESVHDALWDWRMTDNSVYFSARLLEMLGYAANEVEMTLDLWREHMHPDDRQDNLERLQAHIRGETPRYETEFRARHRAGHWIWICSRGRIVERDGQGLPLRMVGTHSDVTQRRQAEEEALHQLRFIEELVEIIPNAIYFKDRLGRYIGCNRACEQLFGLRREDWLNRTVRELAGPQAADEEDARDEALYRDGGIQTYETQVHLAGGDVRDVLFSKTLFTGAQGDVGGILGVITDITEQKRGEAVLRDAKMAAEAASRAKSEFLANMSHEIRTPMNGIMGLVDLTLETPLNDSQRRYLTLVKSSASSLLNIINDILDLSRIEAGRMSVEQLAFDVRTVLQEATAPLEVRAREKRLVLQCTVAPDVPALLVSDPLRLRQILVNLVGNAIKFTRQGRVDVSAWAETQARGPVLHLCVADTGVGIAPDKLERIFESFTQADNSTTREFGGTGLGLTISRRLAQALGGHLWAESEPGQGSRFHLSLPLVSMEPFGHQAEAVESAREYVAAAAMNTNVSRDKARTRFESTAYRGLDELEVDAGEESGNGLRVLLIDDHAVNRFIATSLIRRFGHRVTTAVTADEALELFEAAEFDLIFMDIQIPGMSGVELTHRIRAIEAQRGRSCPIVALTAHAMPLDRARCIEAGMDDYLTKPVEQERLQSVLRLVARAHGRR